jgi:hypothetical protein
MPPVKLIDRGCDDFEAWKTHYGAFVQNIRMVSCKGENVWARGGQEWSIAAVGVDRRGRLLFIHSRSPYTPHDLIENLLSLPLGLAGAMYVEGGPEAQLYIHSGDREIERVGSRGTSLFDSGDNDGAEEGLLSRGGLAGGAARRFWVDGKAGTSSNGGTGKSEEQQRGRSPGVGSLRVSGAPPQRYA